MASLAELFQVMSEPQSDRWFASLGLLEPGVRDPITLTAVVLDDVGGSASVTLTAEVRADLLPGEPDLSYRSFSHGVDAGMVWVNSENVRHLPTPFGGMKSSGIGRDGGDYSFDFYMETKNIALAMGDHKIPRLGA